MQRTQTRSRDTLADRFWRFAAKRLRKHLVSMPYIHGSRERFVVGKNVILNNATLNTRGGEIRINDNVMFGHNVSLLTGIHDYTKRGGERIAIEDARRDIVIEQGAWIASNVTVVGPARIGEDAVVAAGSVVVHDVPARTIVAGNHAKVVRYLLPTQLRESMRAAG
jgi:acetyltransferase-like isoleucine patch superfamily enzyme